jgi:hypothetical protein
MDLLDAIADVLGFEGRDDFVHNRLSIMVVANFAVVC